jgi:TolB-like protein/class 3 adenylate cyclase/Tfp pilus assembly protein PilF
MTTEGSRRKLAAILSADVKEYSRLMSQDERGTIRTLEYKGRVVDSPGDNLLAEFGSVVDSVNCAVEIQRELGERNAELTPARQMEFRIGINLGDVVEEEGRIYGDGVNIAARVETLAEGGGICISGTAYDQVVDKLGLEYEFLGEQEVKNIERPVRVYRVLSFPGAAAHRVVKAKESVERKWRKAALAIAAMVIVVAGAVAIWNFYFRPPSIEPASEARMAFQLPDKPSIAVLPFVNMSGDQGQEYLSEGITENIITALSKCPELFVIARTSTSKYKGMPVEVRQVAEELGVRYVLEGSVQRSGDRIRMTAQLCDAIDGRHLWADRYDGDVEDIFALQDDITVKTLKAVQVTLTEGKKEYLFGESTDNLGAFEKYSEAMYKATELAQSRQLLREAIELDPMFVAAHVWLGWNYMFGVWLGSTKSPEEDLEKAYQLVQKTITLNDSAASPHSLMGKIYLTKRQWEEAFDEGKRAVAINPNSADAHTWLGCIYGFYGKPEESIYWLEKASRLDPYPNWVYFCVLAMTYAIWERYNESNNIYKKVLQLEPNNLFAYIGLTINYSLLDRKEKARETATDVLRLFPAFNAEYHIKAMAYPDAELFIDALHDVGLPVNPSEHMCFWKRLNKQGKTE